MENNNQNNQKLNKLEVRQVIKYIGVDGGYLGSFSYKTHRDFYYDYCGLENIDVYKLRKKYSERGGSIATHDLFEIILLEAPTNEQAKILEGVLKKYSLDEFSNEEKRKQYQHIEQLIARLRTATVINYAEIKTDSATVERAIADADLLLKNNRAISAVDRVHTALHGYLLHVCKKQNLAHQERDSITELFKIIKEKHTKFVVSGGKSDEIEKILKSMSAILHNINEIRNQASMVHPNQNLLHDAEAQLAINAALTVFRYLHAKIGND